MKRSVWLYFFIALSVGLPPALRLPGQDDILIHLRLYKGGRGTAPAAAKVSTAYTLRPLFVGHLVSQADLQEEAEELKRVFNLTELVTLAQTQWGWERSVSDKRFQLVVLNDHEFQLQVTKTKSGDGFRVEVTSRENEKVRSLLDTEIVLPEKKTSVFGFEDSLGHPYFLALQRPADSAFVRSEAQPAAADLRLVHMVAPVLPMGNTGAQRLGAVVLEVKVAQNGNVVQATIIDSQSTIGDAVLNAVSKWRFAPLPANIQPITITVSCFFSRDQADYVINPAVMQTLAPATPAMKNFEGIIRAWQQKNGNKNDEGYDFNFNQADLLEALKMISQSSGVPLQMDERIPAKVNCKLAKVPWQTALALFLETNHLEIADEGTCLRIFSTIPTIAPIKGYITSVFGERLNPFTQVREFHPGLDIAAQLGTPVACAADGKVIVAEFNSGYGNTLVVDHGNGYATRYAKLETMKVKKGDAVKLGQVIATVGSTGISTSPHLHYEVQFKGKPLNPFDFIRDWSK